MTSLEHHFDSHQGLDYAVPGGRYEPQQRHALHEAVAKLRAFAVLLCADVDLANELVEVTLLRASVAMNPAGFATNLSTWLISRLRGYYYREYAHRPTLTPPQLPGFEHGEVLTALAKVRAQQREALVLVEAIKFSSGEAARICRQPPGRFTTLLEGARADLARHLAKQGSGGPSQDSVSLALLVPVQEWV